MRQRTPHAAACVVLLLMSSACTTAPKATVELSEIVDQQILEMQKSHEAFVRLYYEKLREDVQQFMEARWIPEFLARAVENAEFKAEHESATRLARIEEDAVKITIDDQKVRDQALRDALREAVEEALNEQKAYLGQVLIAFSEEALNQIRIQRKKLMDPIDAQEKLVLSELREGYADLMRATAATKAYLQSVVNLTKERDEVLRKLGLLETQQKILSAAVKANDATVALAEGAEDAEEGLQALVDAFKATKARLEAIKEGRKPSEGTEGEQPAFGDKPDEGSGGGNP